MLAIQGLRATSRGGHLAVQYAVEARLGRTRNVIAPFGLLRRTRNEADYPQLDTPAITTTDALDDLEKAGDIVDAMAAMVPNMGPF